MIAYEAGLEWFYDPDAHFFGVRRTSRSIHAGAASIALKAQVGRGRRRLPVQGSAPGDRAVGGPSRPAAPARRTGAGTSGTYLHVVGQIRQAPSLSHSRDQPPRRRGGARSGGVLTTTHGGCAGETGPPEAAPLLRDYYRRREMDDKPRRRLPSAQETFFFFF